MVNGRKRQVCTSVKDPPLTVFEKILFLISIPVCVLEVIARQLMALALVDELLPNRFIELW